VTALAGYRALRKRDFRWSQLGLFGAFRSQKVLLTRKPVERVFFLGLGDEKYLELEAVTNRPVCERAALAAEVRYYSLLGKELEVETPLAKQDFFADSHGRQSPQRLWIKRPKGAVFARVSLQRAVKERRIGIEAKLKLVRATASILDVSEIETCRDQAALIRSLASAKKAGDRQAGKLLLSRAIFLWQRADHARELALLLDTEQLLERSRGNMPCPGANTTIMQYDRALSGVSPDGVSLSKWAGFEAELIKAELVKQRADGLRIDVSAGPSAILPARLLAQEGVSVSCDMPLATVIKPAGFEWISDCEYKALYRSSRDTSV
jgi:hypothetical protein